MRVSLADDSVLFRDGLARLLGDLGMDVMCAVGTGTELLERVDVEPPDVAILDLRMPPTFTDEGLTTAQSLQLRHPGTGVLLLSTYAESPCAASLLANGAHKVGYLLKDRVDDPRSLRDAVERLHRGQNVIDAGLIAQLIGQRTHVNQMERLSPRERIVLQLMAEGRSNTGIGRILCLSNKTIETHVSSLFTKLDLVTVGDDNRRVLAVLSWLRSPSHATPEAPTPPPPSEWSKGR